MNKEIFKQCLENANYEIGTMGTVRNRKTGRTLLQPVSNSGYKRVYLYSNGKSKPYSVHRLMASAFLECADELRNQVNHKDGNKLNNVIDNLEWCTPSENALHAFASGLEKRSRYQTEMIRLGCNKRHPPVRCVETGQIFTDYVVAAKALGVHKSGIWHVLNGDQQTTGGLHFESVK